MPAATTSASAAIPSAIDDLNGCIVPPFVGSFGSSTAALPNRYRAATVRLALVEFRILGPLEVVQEGRPVPLGGPKQRATLAILLLHANRVVPVERLADDLYSGAPPATAVTQAQRQTD